MERFADVSVIMPAYNAAGTVARALASIAAQTVKPREVIVVDDGSHDGTDRAVLAMVPAMNGIRLRLFRQPNRGAGAARNRALAAASCEFLGFLDSDDEWMPTKLERSMAVMAAEDLVMSSHDIIEITVAGERHVDCRSRYLANPDDPFRTLYLRGFISSSTVVVKRDAVLAAGGFNAGLRSAQDYDLWLAVLAHAGRRFTTFGEPLLRYYLFEGGITSHTDRRLACDLRIACDHLGSLKRIPGPVWRLAALRVLVCHLVAWREHRARGRGWPAAISALKLPANLLRLFMAIPGATENRLDFLAQLDEDAEELTARSAHELDKR